MKKLHLKQFIKEEILNVLKESVNESQEYYITYNKGRGQGKGLLKKTYSSYEEAKKSADMMGYNSMVAYWVSDKDMNPIKSD